MTNKLTQDTQEFDAASGAITGTLSARQILKGLASSAGAAAITLMLAAVPAHAQTTSDDTTADSEQEDEIVVVGFRRSLADSLETKRDADQILDAITAEEIGLFPDQNVTEALQRITGVQITRNNGEGETVNIRGLSAGFTRVEVDGRSTQVTLDSANPERQSVLSVFASELYNAIEVVKSPTAADIEGGIGGIVRLKTPDPLDIGELRWGIDGSITDAEQRDDTEPAYTGFFSNVFADGRVGLLLSATYEERDRAIDKFQSNQNWIEVEEGDLSDSDDPEAQALIGARYPGRLRQEQKVGDSTKLNLNAKLQVQATENLELSLDTYLTQEERDEDRSRIQVQFSRGDLISGTVDDEGTLVEGVFDRQRTEFASFTRETTIDTFGITGGADWDNGVWALSGEASFASSEEDLIEYRASTRINRDGVGGYSIVNDPEYPELFTEGTSSDPADLETRQLDRERRLVSIEESAVRGDIERSFDHGFWSSVEAGFRFASTEFERRQGFQASEGEGSLTFADGNTDFVVDGSFADGFGSDDVLTVWPSVDPKALYNQAPSTEPFSFNDRNLFTITEDNGAFYGMGNIDAENLFGLYARGNLGARVVTTDYAGQGRVRVIDEDGEEQFFDDVPELDQSYTEVLPAFNLLLSETPESNLIFRGALTRALSRPEVEQINPSVSINAEDQEVEEGNPDLNPFVAWQYDLGVEYYFGPSSEGLFSITFFYKDIEEFVFESAELVEGLTFAEFGLTDPLDYVVSTFENGGDATVQGVEIGFQTPLSFLPAPLSNFGVFTNYTYTDSEFTDDQGLTQPFPGASETAYNLAGYYEQAGFSTRLAYTYRDEFLLVPADSDGVNAQFGDEQGRLDFAARYRFENGLRFAFDALNLTEEQSYKYYDTPTRLEDLEVEGRIFTFSVGYTY